MCNEVSYRLPVTSLAERRPGMNLEDFRFWIDYRDSERRSIYDAIAKLREMGAIVIKGDRVFPAGCPL